MVVSAAQSSKGGVCSRALCVQFLFSYQHCCLFPFPWPFLSTLIAGMADDPPTPCRPVQLLARSQSSTCHVI